MRFLDFFFTIYYKNMKKENNLSGTKNGNLLIIEYCKIKENDKIQRRWKCLCDCGKIIYIRTSRLNGVEKATTHCGCLSDEWTEISTKLLIDNYEKMDYNELIKKLNKTKRAICIKASRLGLKKDKSFFIQSVIERNKTLFGRDLNLENLKQISKKFTTEREFREKDCSAYQKAKEYGLRNVCDHLIPIYISIPQLILKEILTKLFTEEILYNTRKIIRPYELDVFIPKYNIGFEYDGTYWHSMQNNDKIKNELCIKNNIKLFRIIETNKNDYVIDIKNQLICILKEINDVCNKNITLDEIKNIDIDIDFIKNKHLNIFNEYSSLLVFAKENYSLYRKLKKYKLIQKYCSHMIFDLPKSMKSPF